jgi:hypothetical protein
MSSRKQGVFSALARRMADPHRPHPCEVANLQEVSWLMVATGRELAKFERKAAELQSARLPRLCTAIGLTATTLFC